MAVPAMPTALLLLSQKALLLLHHFFERLHALRLRRSRMIRPPKALPLLQSYIADKLLTLERTQTLAKFFSRRRR